MRSGKCLRCCRFKFLWDSLNIWEKIGFYIMRPKGLFMRKSKIRCPFLIFEYGKAKCVNYLKRPEFCQKYPGCESDLIDKNCGFKFYA